MLSCPQCQSPAREGSAFCQVCGTALRDAGPPGPACPDCGTRNPPGTNYCQTCGRRLAELTPRPAPVGGPAAGPRGTARLVAVRRDGADGESYPLEGEQLDVGRTEGDLLFDDPHLAPRHARIAVRGGQHVLVPLETANGIYLRIRQQTELASGDHVLLGKQVLRFEQVSDAEKTLRPALQHGVVLFGTPVKPPWGRLMQLTAAGTCRDVYHLTRSDTVLGREQGDIVFADDEFLSRRHAQLQFRAGRIALLDLGSSNGTYVRLRAPHPLSPGDMIRMGDELLRFEIG